VVVVEVSAPELVVVAVLDSESVVEVEVDTAQDAPAIPVVHE
jgi:hypothetical protein